MPRMLARTGNLTTKGYVIHGTSSMYEEGRAYVRSGDLAYCKVCEGVFPILGTVMSIIDERPMAAFGDKVMCKCPDHWVIAQSTWFCEDQGSSQITRSSPVVKPSSFAETSTPSSPTPVFAKSCLRGSGCTDAGTSAEPADNFGKMSFYQATALGIAASAETASTAEGIVTTIFRYLGGTASGAIMGRFATPNPVTVGLFGVLFSAGLNSGEEDYLDQKRLEQLAAQNGNAPTRVRFEWVMDSATGKMKVNGYHTGAGMLSSEVPVRAMRLNSKTGFYEFWEDGASGPSILWTPDNPGFKLPQHTGNEDVFVPPPTITVLPIPEDTGAHIETLPMPEERTFRDYILVHPQGDFEPIYIYLAKPPVKLVEVELYSDFEGRSREGLYHADHMPSAAAVKAYLKRKYPKLDKRTLDLMAQDVATIIVPAEVHRKISETYGGRNTPQQIEEDSWELKSALDRNFEAIRPALKEYGITDTQLDKAQARMHEINRKQGLY